MTKQQKDEDILKQFAEDVKTVMKNPDFNVIKQMQEFCVVINEPNQNEIYLEALKAYDCAFLDKTDIVQQIRDLNVHASIHTIWTYFRKYMTPNITRKQLKTLQILMSYTENQIKSLDNTEILMDDFSFDKKKERIQEDAEFLLHTPKPKAHFDFDDEALILIGEWSSCVNKRLLIEHYLPQVQEFQIASAAETVRNLHKEQRDKIYDNWPLIEEFLLINLKHGNMEILLETTRISETLEELRQAFIKIENEIDISKDD